MRTIRKQCVAAIRSLFEGDDDECYATRSLELASTMTHVMEFTSMRCLEALFALIRRGIDNVIECCLIDYRYEINIYMHDSQ